MSRIVASMCGVVVAVAASPVQAQGAPADMNDIVVTARLVSENLQDVPLAVSAVGGIQMERAGIRNVKDLSALAPNLIIQSTNTGAGATTFTIRGQNAGDLLLTVDSAVGLYVDGVNVPRSYGTAASFVDIKRVEILRGPQGTLYGRNTTGGAVSIVTNEPTAAFGAMTQATGGNYGLATIQGIVNAPLADNVGIRVAGQQSRHRGYGRDIPLDRAANKDDSTYLRATIRGEFGDLTAVLRGDYSRTNNGRVTARVTGVTADTLAGNSAAALEVALDLGLASSLAGLTPGVLQQAGAALQSYVGRGSFYDTYNNGFSESRAEVYSGNLTLEYKLPGDLTLKSITGYRHMVSNFAFDEGTPFDILSSLQPTRDRFISEEMQVIGGNELFNYVFGGYFSYEKGFQSETTTALAALQGGRLTLSEGEIRSKSVAGFGQANIKLFDPLTLTLGGRLTKEVHSISSGNNAISSTGTSYTCTIGAAFVDNPTDYNVANPATCIRSASNTFSKPTWLASLNYRVNPDILIYGKVSRGFRGGGQSFRATGDLAALYAAFAPEVVTEYELGFKSQLFDRRVRLNLAVFNDDFKNVQRTVTLLLIPNPPTIGSVITNAAKARLRGVEGEVDVRLGGGLTASGTFGYLDPQYKSFVDFSGDRSKEPWPAPHWVYTISGNYSRPTDLGTLNANISWQWQSTTYAPGQTNAVNIDQLRIRPYGLLNGRVAFDVKKWDIEVAAFARNLLGRHYYTSGLNLESLGFNLMYVGEPRIFGVQLTKHFGAGV